MTGVMQRIKRKLTRPEVKKANKLHEGNKKVLSRTGSKGSKGGFERECAIPGGKTEVNAGNLRRQYDSKQQVSKKITLEQYINTMTKIREFSLTISERIAAIKIFDEFKGGLGQLSQILEDVKGCVVTEEEWEKAKLVKTATKDKDGNAAEAWNWSDEGSDKSVSLGQVSIDYLRGKIKAKSEANEITLQDKALISLSEKLG